jgi:hypothetical protein
VVVVLKSLEESSFVHDFRDNNVLVEVDSDNIPILSETGIALFKVVDFDWAGRSILCITH